ncbi:penicillin-binding protein 2 [Cryomorpha ignava]|uniref:Penicillin-binding protein 2 n=1 Tax=Cryomorpha ignava TaxID=101383 RepID=A0A7K3WNH4_9FLAO|nr:penicillin-binding protein 2 [Cryomorpha ignava]NEN23044.1 penicillin-binding protein 2 [Cryomorpha ignava]
MNLSDRKFVIVIIFITIGLIFSLRLFFLQVVDEEWKVMAASASERVITEYPARGLIYDRNGELLVSNTAVYDLMVIPRDMKNIDTLAFCALLEIDTAEFNAKINAARKYSRYKPTAFAKQIPAALYVDIAENLYRFPGFYGQPRTLRYYPEPIAAHTMGYVSEVTPSIIEKNNYYQRGDYIGANGIESIYEEPLRGKRGKRLVLVDVHNNEQGSFADGQYDTLATVGKNLTSSLDLQLQAYGEKLMKNKRGSIVAIEPATGEILCLITNPNYDPNLLVGRVRGKNYKALSEDTLKPLFNRALMARYPPGSTFKLLQGLIGLDEKVIDENTSFSCHGGYYYAGRRLGCHAHASPVSLLFSIQTSCNAYYCNVFKRILDKYPTSEEGYTIWREHLAKFGLGSRLMVDMTSEVSGFVPASTYYDKFYGRNRWNAHTVISLAIGQGELGITPLQVANFTAAIANRGWYYTPHVIKEIDGEAITDSIYTQKHVTGISKENFEMVIEGMYRVIESGTGRGVRFSKDIEVCGKTGTAQNPHGKDHSIFIAFAPKDDPKIAIAVYVENVGFGSTWAAPITSLMIEQYLTDTITRPRIETRMLEADLLHNH